MQTYLNRTGVSLSVAVYLATDHYDYIPNTISATGIMKPVRQQILTRRVPPEQNQVDVLQVMKSRIGTSIHDSIEKAWVGEHYKKAMAALGYPESVIERVVINPEETLRAYGYDTAALKKAGVIMFPGTVPEDAIAIYMEIRNFREIDGKTVSGKFDFLAEGRLEDFKSTSTFTWVNGTKTEDYQLQGSIYRWLNPKIILEDHMAIQFFFTDWMPGKAKQDPKYPNRPVEKQLIPLMDLSDTEEYIRGKLNLHAMYMDSPEAEIPFCTDKDLWRKDPEWKYYKNPAKRTRSTKNFSSAAEAHARWQEDGGVGVVVEKPGEVVACKYCAAFPVCTQKDQLIADGSLCLE